LVTAARCQVRAGISPATFLKSLKATVKHFKKATLPKPPLKRKATLSKQGVGRDPRRLHSKALSTAA
jgi:hypothetical protein